MAIPDCYEITPKQYGDNRGIFFESYRFDRLQEIAGRRIDLRQVNTSVSKKGTVRGVHFADIPQGQAKYVFVTQGAVVDYAIDIRVGSSAYGTWDSSVLDDVDRRALFLSEGIGHCFVALTEKATVTYLVTDVYRPEREHGITPLDEQVALDLPFAREELLFSEKDAEAMTLDQAHEAHLLPTWDEARKLYASFASQ